jgi:hypothetical protein
MATPKRSKEISAHTTNLLREGESARVDYKRAVEGISTDDLVAFANSEGGGIILAGVDERVDHGGVQVGFVVGCEVSDAAILQIANKALSCFPPVAIEVYVENIVETPFLRIDVLPSPTRPHCTPKGVYCRRDGSRNRPLHPSELLRIFLESESRAFSERFESAANRITKDLTALEARLDGTISAMGDQLGWAEHKLGDTDSTLDTILAYVHRLNSETNDLTTRIRAMFRQDKRHDPIYERERKKVLDQMVDKFVQDEQMQKIIKEGKSFECRVDRNTSEELNKDDLECIVREAVKIVADQTE